jgi:hypothetical protein
MNLSTKLLLAALAFATTAMAKPSVAPATDAQIREALIQQSIASTPGNCPCPFSTAANGSQCGKRSSYSRGGGYTPVCYPKDVTAEMIRDYRSRN